MSFPQAEQYFKDLIQRLAPALPPDATLVSLNADAELLLARLIPELPQLLPTPRILHFSADTVLSAEQRQSLNQSIVVIFDTILADCEKVLGVCNWLRSQGVVAPLQLAVLADRGGRTLPFAPTYCGGALIVATDVQLTVIEDEKTLRFVELSSD